MISAERGQSMNLFNRVVPSKELEAVTRTLAGQIAAGPALLVAEVKRTLRSSLAGSLDEVLELETEAQMRAFNSPDFREGIDSFIEKRAPRFGKKANGQPKPVREPIP
jgi:2-(1,2-epoxy-1,2-dihydrophenyl)acetyl-CoA isomerase